MKSDKKALLIVIVLMLLFSIPQIALATGDNPYNIEKIDITLTIPSNLIVFTQETAPNDPSFSDFGLDGYSIIQSYKDSSIYLNAISDDGLYEIIVTMIEYDGSKAISDFRRYNDSDLKTFADEMDSIAADYNNITYIDHTIYEHSQAKFIVFNIKQPDGYGGTAYGKQYYTILGGRAINITLHSYNGEISTDQNNLLKQVVDGTTFGTSYPKKANNVSSSSLFSGVLYKGLVGAASGGIIIAIIMLYRFMKRSVKKATAKKQSHNEPKNEVILTKSISYENRITCNSCGADLLPDSVFCNKCGEKVKICE